MLRRLILVLVLTSITAWAQHPDDVFVGQKAPELKQGDVWINSTPLKLEQLHGKVVLIDFWAFDCPFCSEAMPQV
jgi:thiol-disulfide isomerase/thioredoxin